MNDPRSKENVLKLYATRKNEVQMATGILIERLENPKGLISDNITRSTFFTRQLIGVLLPVDQLAFLSDLALRLLIANNYSFPSSRINNKQHSFQALSLCPFIYTIPIVGKCRFITKTTLDAFAIREILNYEHTKIKDSLSLIERKEIFHSIRFNALCQVTEESKKTIERIEHLIALQIKSQQYETAAKYRDLIHHALRDKFIEDWPNLRPIDLTFLEKNL